MRRRFHSGQGPKRFGAAIGFHNGGEQAIRTGFEHVGRLAMQELSVDPKVSAATGSLSEYADTRKMIQAVSE
ncbi:hypothetical protein [Azohydromonas caseinilytica]|uniref:Uncharacterized protein n=1 Tax=Azohydromonas caseinilytica TaxID=2728836 RepID=A0A848FE24_9BURK|nr:hypothetical protein [Azohydromonas caseinilytica]NML17648.1 hypothetical protein [Azohydromonas caseinilytica]